MNTKTVKEIAIALHTEGAHNQDDRARRHHVIGAHRFNAATVADAPEAPQTKVSHTPGPWTIHEGGGHAYPSIRGSESIHTNGRQRNSQGISSASYSEEVCTLRCDLELPGPQANARLIAAAPDLLVELKHARFLEAATLDELRDSGEQEDGANIQASISNIERYDAVIAKAEAAQ